MAKAATPGELLQDAAWALSFRTIAPAEGDAKRLLVLVHGWAADELQLASVGAPFANDTLVVLPRGPRSANEDAWGWFRVQFDEGEPQAMGDEAEESRVALVAFIGQLQERHAIAPERTVIAGFSQGGTLSASVALTAPERVAGFAVVSGRILPEIEASIADNKSLAHLRALLVHGRGDDTLPPDWAHRAAALLDARGVAHALRLHDAGHELTDPMREDLRTWFASTFARS